MPLLQNFPGAGSSGTLGVYTAAETIAAFKLVALDSAGEIVHAEAGFSANRWRVIGVTAASVTTGNPVIVFTGMGSKVNVAFASAPPTADNGKHVFLSISPGEGIVVPPTGAGRVRFMVGVLQGADGVTATPVVLFQPSYVSRIP